MGREMLKIIEGGEPKWKFSVLRMADNTKGIVVYWKGIAVYGHRLQPLFSHLWEMSTMHSLNAGSSVLLALTILLSSWFPIQIISLFPWLFADDDVTLHGTPGAQTPHHHHHHHHHLLLPPDSTGQLQFPPQFSAATSLTCEALTRPSKISLSALA